MTGFWQDKVRTLKKYIGALYLSLKRKDTPWYAKFFIGIVVAYALSPIDLIPDFIPVLGYLDDMILLPLGIYLAIRLVPQKILKECVAESEHIWMEGKPKNWLMGLVIILIWIFLACALGRYCFDRN